jgi:hypothetical protein
MLSFISLLFSMIATFIGSIFCVPPGKMQDDGCPVMTNHLIRLIRVVLLK